MLEIQFWGDVAGDTDRAKMMERGQVVEAAAELLTTGRIFVIMERKREAEREELQ